VWHPFIETMITQRDIARRLGVSASLVSRALTGTAQDIGASPQTIRRIREEASRSNYRPSAAALTLRGVPTKTLGVIVKDFQDPFFGSLIGELHALAYSQQASLILIGCVPGQEPQVDLPSLLRYRLDGIIVLGSDFDPAGLDMLPAQEIPIVQIGQSDTRQRMARVRMDQDNGLDELVAYLRQLGHRDIGYISDDSLPNLRREKILLEVIRRQDLVVRPNACVRVPARDSDSGYRAMRCLLQQCGELLPTAVIAADDVIAHAALRALFEAQIRVPKDLSLAGVDDIPSSHTTIPSLTTLRQPAREMAQAAFQVLTSPTGKGKARGTREVVITPKLMIRESCAPPRERRPVG
jgi:DNA-binding LacI/PurR family transcriptional regulator